MFRGKETMNALMTVTVMFFLNILKTAGECPRYCECKWKSGKESVLCANANMTEIPRHLDSGTQLLDLTGNRLERIGPDEFFNASLLNLQKIFLSRCRLRFIEKSSFRKIINLVELDLSYNELHSVPSHTFEFITELRELRLNGNPIIRVLNNAFKMVPRLTKLDLSECRIGYVEMKAFQGLEISLEWLKLDKNKIVNIKPFALVNLKNLHGLELSGNPWNCSCELRLLREWMVKRNVPYSIPPVCRYPSRIADRDWDKLDLDEFACPPRIQAVSSLEEGEEGGNVTLSCAVRGNPEPEVWWLRRNHVLVNTTGDGIVEKAKVYMVRFSKDTSNLTILAAEIQDGGSYTCRAENKAGRSEANVTLTMTKKPPARVWSSRMIAAVGAVSLLFALAAGLLMFCAWSSRKRKFDFRHPVRGRNYENADNYEMNHKKPINYNKIVNYGNHFGSNSTANDYDIAGKNSQTENLSERTPEISHGGYNRIGDFPPSTQTSGSGLREEKIWDSLKITEMEDRQSESSNNSRLSPDLHIPRLNNHESLKNSPGAFREINFPEGSPCTLATSASFLSDGEQRRFANPETSKESQVQFASGQPKQQIRSRIRSGKYPDLLVLSKNTENLINNNNSFSTMPRKRSYKMKKTRHGSIGSDSQSPLLPGSSGESCDSNFSLGRSPSIGSGAPNSNTSLSTSPGNLNRNLILNAALGEESREDFPKTPKTLNFKSVELEKFLKEYRSLQDQLYKMKKTCGENEDNVRYREGEGGVGGDASGRFETDSISKLISSNYPDSTSGSDSFHDLRNKKYLDDSIYGTARLAEEDNNNPKSILDRKRSESKPEVIPRESFRFSGEKFIENLTEPDLEENSLYRS